MENSAESNEFMERRGSKSLEVEKYIYIYIWSWESRVGGLVETT
jgi:hypothetical protein